MDKFHGVSKTACMMYGITILASNNFMVIQNKFFTARAGFSFSGIICIHDESCDTPSEILLLLAAWLLRRTAARKSPLDALNLDLD